jgi:hypothetical protein
MIEKGCTHIPSAIQMVVHYARDALQAPLESPNMRRTLLRDYVIGTGYSRGANA